MMGLQITLTEMLAESDPAEVVTRHVYTPAISGLMYPGSSSSDPLSIIPLGKFLLLFNSQVISNAEGYGLPDMKAISTGRELP